ncbi:hypothetical protein G3I19_11070 [Streptomyces sp. SID10853]|uniref:hypothetical protein n=1 Tax=Streptomyces sp. SID10853 TaxID=2706028 RepID=UPI0013C21E78|nr:hypothetical protein [Streptomyces sp. SID10853]NDZ79053.1 hypothetical protein [Streptomyces sp. SID10853]
MSSHDSPPSGCTSFEQELVNAMNDYAGTARTPDFDTATIARGARRKRATAIAGIATALVVAGAGTALAVGAVGGDAHTTAQTAATATGSTTLLVRTSDGGTATERLAGVSAARARATLVHFGLKPHFTRVKKADCQKPEDAVVSLSPHAPTVVHAGDTVLVTTCYR